MIWETVNLTHEEYLRAVELLGREPNELELEMIGVMWSEHCSYKSSRAHLRRLPTGGAQVLQGPGENAGVLDLGGDMALALRCESHNHPTAVNPYHGAATGVGGILRDIFTMGARPVAVLNSLRFAEPADPRSRYLLREAVKGIRDFCAGTGVKPVGGEIYFESCYASNPLVNVMALGLVRKDRIIRGRAEGAGNPVFVIGGLTGRQGVRSASHASQELNESSTGNSAIQTGDPELARRLMAACLELIDSGSVVGMNDLGAAGLTSASAETAHRAGRGVEIDVAAVPVAEVEMSPVEIMLSESQERMFLIVDAARQDRVYEVATKWQVHAARIGRVTDDGILRVVKDHQVLAEIPVSLLTEAAPVYQREQKEPEALENRWRVPALPTPAADDTAAWTDTLIRLLSSPALGSRGWLRDQLDPAPGGAPASVADAALVPIPGSRGGVAASIDGNGRFAYLDPYRGAMLAVAEAARNVACAGARPLGLTNCLNMGNPERPEVMWQFSQVIDGMAAAAQVLNTPVTGGNVSFYNEAPAGQIFPTPVIGMVGVIDDIDSALSPGWQGSGETVVLLGPVTGYLDGSEYLRTIHGLVAGRPPLVDLELERRLIELLLAAHQRGWLRSAHDVSDGGLAVALAEACFAAVPPAVGARVQLPATGEVAELLFGEAPSRVVVSVVEDCLPRLLDLAAGKAVPAIPIGTTGGGRLEVSIGQHLVISADVETLRAGWDTGISRWLS